MCSRALYVTSSPLKSPSRNGPMGQLRPFSTAMSMSSKFATPASSRWYASCVAAWRMRLTMNPSIFLLMRTGVRPIARAIAIANGLGQVGGSPHPGAGRLRVLRGQAPLLNAASQVSAVRFHRLPELIVRLVVKGDVDAMQCGLLGDLGAHRPRSDYSQTLHQGPGDRGPREIDRFRGVGDIWRFGGVLTAQRRFGSPRLVS